MSDEGTTIEFCDGRSDDEGCAIVRRCDDLVAVCLSLRSGGDVEVLLGKEDVAKLIEALCQASNTDLA